MDRTIEQWQIAKPVARSRKGVVAAQNARAAEVGVEVLRAGGNAVDAAVAAGFALGVAEPWMSGLGGGGYMLVYLAAEGRVHVVDFSMVAPRALDPSAFPLAGGGRDDDLFGWPAVEGDRNVAGPLSIATPGTVDGFGLALERFGTMPWRDVLEPAAALARRGHPVDWWTTLKVAGEAGLLARDEAARGVYLPGGLPPVAAETGTDYLDLGALPDTLEHLATAGRRDFYEGGLAERLAAELSAAGSVLSREDLAGYRARVVAPLTVERGDARIHLLPGLSAGPTFADALARLPAIAKGAPGPGAYAGYAEALAAATARRLEEMGHSGDTAGQGSTTHISVIDGAGNMVACTNTLLSLFGSKVILPGTGVLMNNGIMWFDPRPGRPNSIAPGVRPLSNMCPVAVTREGAPWFALGASGGRRILPAAFQLVSFLVDCGLSLEEAVHLPRLNVDGSPTVEADRRLPLDTIEAVAARLPVAAVEALVSPNKFANPLVVLRDGDGCLGAAPVRSPVAAALGA
ncbi:MAG: gamma-glutamyltransferase [Rhodospirillales bacterium]|nr:gamma-glutamyltransferase [Rhodospirillales bacterium]MDH3965915.1 gamma-glutamyltransferase [Rhodospirillales bacterium]